MAAIPLFKKSLIRSGIYTVILTAFFLLFSWPHHSTREICIALPYFFLLYFMVFALGKPQVSDWLRETLNGDIRLIFLFPLLLVLLYFSYVGWNQQNPFRGTLFLVPYLLFFPVVVLAAKAGTGSKIDWLDFTVFFLFFFPVTLIDVKPSGDMPFNGGGFDSVYRISVMLTAVFAYTTVRNISDVGFYPVFRWRHLFTVLWVWLIFYVTVFIFGWAVEFIRLKEENSVSIVINAALVKKFIAVFLHTALFEELVFRGLLQNMLAKRIAQSASWKIFWIWGLVILILISFVIGYSLNGAMQWFPALVTVLLCGVAWVMETRRNVQTGAYTALAITSVVFGLVHAHSGSVVFVGLAAIGGWAYGYVYQKTGNVFYAALLHALVNTTPLLFGLELAK